MSNTDERFVFSTNLQSFTFQLGWDKFCWRCKTCEPGLETCSGCIRCFHPVCLKLNPAFFIVEKKWNCPECIKAEAQTDGANEKPSKDVKLKQDSLTISLKFTMKRMLQLKGVSRSNILTILAILYFLVTIQNYYQ